MLAVLEVFAFVATRVVDQKGLFDHRESVFERLNDKDLAIFLSKGADPVLG